jgi:hypothetical protein
MSTVPDSKYDKVSGVLFVKYPVEVLYVAEIVPTLFSEFIVLNFTTVLTA